MIITSKANEQMQVLQLWGEGVLAKESHTDPQISCKRFLPRPGREEGRLWGTELSRWPGIGGLILGFLLFSWEHGYLLLEGQLWPLKCLWVWSL